MKEGKVKQEQRLKTGEGKRSGSLIGVVKTSGELAKWRMLQKKFEPTALSATK